MSGDIGCYRGFGTLDSWQNKLTSPSFSTQIQRAKAEKLRERTLKEEMDAKRAKNKALRERRQERVESKRNAQGTQEE